MLAAEDAVRGGRAEVRRRARSSSRRPTGRSSRRRSRSSACRRVAVASVPTVKTHELDVPRIGYVHSWSNTQNEGWVRMAFDKLKIPYTYIGRHEAARAEPAAEVRRDHLPARRRHGRVAGERRARAGEPIPYKKTDLTPNLGVQDSADDIRGGMGFEGLINLMKFVQEGGLLITEGSTSTIFPDYNLVERRHRRGADRPVRARRRDEGAVRRQEEPDRLRLRQRQPGGLLQLGRRC